MQVTAAEIRQALDQGEFRFFYQPKVSFLTGQVSGAEALIRWQRDERAYVAGSVAQNCKERIRDYREDRYRRDRYYNRHHDHYHHDHNDGDNDLSRLLIGVAIGAVATGVIMHNNQSNQ